MRCENSANVHQLLEPDVLRNPYPAYDAWRRQGPVLWDPSINAWIVTGYEESRVVLRDNSRFGSDWRRIGETTPPSLLSIQTVDPPQHTQVRRLVTEGLKSVNAYSQLDESVTAAAAELLDSATDKGTTDYVNEFAEPLALRMVTQLIGVPQPDRSWFVPLSNTIVDSMDASIRPGFYEPGVAARSELTKQVDEWLDSPLPGGLAEHLLLAARTSDVAKDVLLNTVRVFLQAGFQTASRFLVTGLLTLLRMSPDGRPTVGTNAAVNELARFSGPVHAESRGCIQDTTLGGQSIERGQVVTCLLGAANRDPMAFDNPNVLEPQRSPNLHFAFGRGPHACLGSPFAVRIAQAALELIETNHPKARLVNEPEPRPNITERGFYHLNVELDPAG